MAVVTVISSSIVQPGNITQSSRGKIHLTPFEIRLLYLSYPQRGLLFPKPDPETRFISRLKASLRCSRHLLPLSCRLVKVNNHEENTVSFYIDCNDDGLGSRFVHAIAESVYVSDLLQPDGPVFDSFNHFFHANDFKIIEGISKPLLAIQVTEMKDGVFISFGLPSKLFGPSQISHTDVFFVSSVDRTWISFFKPFPNSQLPLCS